MERSISPLSFKEIDNDARNIMRILVENINTNPAKLFGLSSGLSMAQSCED